MSSAGLGMTRYLSSFQKDKKGGKVFTGCSLVNNLFVAVIGEVPTKLQKGNNCTALAWWNMLVTQVLSHRHLTSLCSLGCRQDHLQALWHKDLQNAFISLKNSVSSRRWSSFLLLPTLSVRLCLISNPSFTFFHNGSQELCVMPSKVHNAYVQFIVSGLLTPEIRNNFWLSCCTPLNDCCFIATPYFIHSTSRILWSFRSFRMKS